MSDYIRRRDEVRKATEQIMYLDGVNAPELTRRAIEFVRVTLREGFMCLDRMGGIDSIGMLRGTLTLACLQGEEKEIDDAAWALVSALQDRDDAKGGT